MTLLTRHTPEPQAPAVKYPGVHTAVDGSTAVVAVETAASDAAGAYPITPSTQMGEGWALAVAQGQTNVHGRRLLFFEPEGEHAAAGVTAGLSMVGLRSTNFSSGQGIAYMHESLYAAAGKRLTYVLNVAARAMTKHALNVHAGHDDYHAVDDTGFFQVFAKNVQEVADLTLIAHRIAELALNPGISAQDGFLTSHVIETIRLPERALIKEYLGDPADRIESPTPAQKLVFGDTRRRIPELFDLDYPAMVGVVQNQDSYAQGVAAQRPFYFDHVAEIADRAMAEYAALTGRHYARASGYRLDDADYVLAGQGSVVATAEVVADHLRATRGLKVGVLNLTMFRPFPADLVSRLLAGKKAVVVCERTDQPLAVDLPLLREIRAAMSQAEENTRAILALDSGTPDAHGLPFPDLALLPSDHALDYYSACFGLGSRDLQPGDLIAAVQNMLPGGARRRQFYLGIDFVRKDTRLPKLQIWQDRLVDAYPHLTDLALPSAGDVNLLPEGALAFRIHSVGGWGAMTMGKNVVMTAFELLGLNVKANPKYGSEKKGQPTTFFGILAREPVRLNGELKHVDVVLSPDPNVFRHSNPLAGLSHGGVFIIQSDREPDELWASLPAAARRTIVSQGIRVFALDAFKIAREEATDAELRYRMQGTAFMGAFFKVSPLATREGLDEATVLDGIRTQLAKKFGHLGERAVEDNFRVISRGFSELRECVPTDADALDERQGSVPSIPLALDVPAATIGVANPGRFWEQVCFLCKQGQDGLADPLAAMSVMPAASSAIRDMTDVRFEVPAFIAEKCTGCSQCWVQCPDSAIPGLVSSVEEVLDTAIAASAERRPMDRMRQVSKHLARECRTVLSTTPYTGFGQVVSTAFDALTSKLGWDPTRRAELDAQFGPVQAALAEFPLAKTRPFYDVPDAKEKGTGGLLSITVNPEACKGCNLCVEVCPDGALVTVRQDEPTLARLRRNWALWHRLPDTANRYVNVANLDEGVGTLSSLLLKRENYLSMVGGDGACMGCGEKTAVHLVVAAINAAMQPRVERHIAHLDTIIAGLDAKGRTLVAAGADLDRAAAAEHLDVTMAPETRQRLERINQLLHQLKDLRWRYVEGPGGHGRARMGMSNSTGCSSVWASTYPYNPYPFPWVNHLFQDSPSVAIGIFEGHMRKMADGFAAVRRAELELADAFDPVVHEKELTAFDWTRFTEDEFALCPPIVAMGGDGAMLDIGFQNLSRLLASGKPVRVVVLDTQVYSNTGGQACTSGFTGQVSDMAADGAARHGKQEVRKELALIAIAHRGTFVHQSSQASASHLMAGILKGLKSHRPAVFNLYTPCPVEHGLADDWSRQAGRLALESRAFPFLTYDPDAGPTFADCLSLDGNPSIDDRWPTYTLRYDTDDGVSASMELPLTIADWAATEGRFKTHFREVPADEWSDAMVPFHEFLELAPESREGAIPFIYAVAQDTRRLRRLQVAREIVALAEERQLFWSQLRQLAGLELADGVRDRVTDALEQQFAERERALRAEYEAKMAELTASYPLLVARRLAEGLLKAADDRSVKDIVAAAMAMPVQTPAAEARPRAERTAAVSVPIPSPPTAPPAPSRAAVPVASPAAPEVAPAPAGDAALAMDPYIESSLCTSCDECTNLNNRVFAYNADKQAYIKDASAGPFAHLVRAAEKCPVGIIHPGTPRNPKEKGLDTLVERAKKFN